MPWRECPVGSGRVSIRDPAWGGRPAARIHLVCAQHRISQQSGGALLPIILDECSQFLLVAITVPQCGTEHRCGPFDDARVGSDADDARQAVLHGVVEGESEGGQRLAAARRYGQREQAGWLVGRRSALRLRHWRGLHDGRRCRRQAVCRQKGPILRSFSAFWWAIFSLTARGRSTARNQSAPSLLLTKG